MTDYRVYTIKLANYLTSRGFTILRTSQDVKKPQFLNWYFSRTPELEAAVQEYLELNR